MFAIEELTTAAFSQALGWQIFFACMLAVLVSNTLRSAEHAVMGGEFGLFEGPASTILYEVSFCCLVTMQQLVHLVFFMILA